MLNIRQNVKSLTKPQGYVSKRIHHGLLAPTEMYPGIEVCVFYPAPSEGKESRTRQFLNEVSR